VDVLKYEDASDPKIQSNEVLARVKACALNHLDIWVRMGAQSWQLPMPQIVGSDVSGEVAEVGSLVTRVKAGDRALLCPGVSCGQGHACSKGLHRACRSYTLLGVMAAGGYAALVKAPEANIIPIPGDLRFDEAAAMPPVFIITGHKMFTRAGLSPGEDVLVIGAGSSVGSAASQIARLAGARVIATAGGDWRLEKARAFGAEVFINHSK
jgi:NADPH:quinone reductase-like Zn-dependent oxidoreductase